MIHLDTSALIAAITADRPAAGTLRDLVDDGHRLGISALVLYEWWRGPRMKQDLSYQELLFPRDAVFSFGAREAAVAADLFRRLSRPRHRAVDLAVAACALVQGAALWTLNPRDFRDITELELI